MAKISARGDEDAHWVAAGVAVTDRASVTHYLIEHRYPGATLA